MKRFLFTAVMLIVGVALFAQDPEPAPEKTGWFWQAISGVLLISTMFFAGARAWVFGKITDLKFMVKEVFELLDYVLKAAADNTFTQEEQQRIVKEAQDIKIAWRKVIGR